MARSLRRRPEVTRLRPMSNCNSDGLPVVRQHALMTMTDARISLADQVKLACSAAHGMRPNCWPRHDGGSDY
jgi:hypothetical protein